MTGSLFWFEYRSDSIDSYSVLVDKSNALATCNAAQLMTSRTGNAAKAKPAYLKERYANTYLQSNPVIRRKFKIGNTVAFANANVDGATIVSSEGTWVITSTRGEKSRRVPAFDAPDTGQTT